VQRFLKRDDGLLRAFRFALGEREEVGELRRVRETRARFEQETLGAFRFTQRADQQLRQAQVSLAAAGIDEKALLKISRRLGELRLRGVLLVRAQERTRFVIEQLRQQIVRLIFLRRLFDDLLQQLDRFRAAGLSP
jgi:hypothetical protein